MKQILKYVCWLLPLSLLLSSCVGPVVEPKPGPLQASIQAVITQNKEAGVVLARALYKSELFTELSLDNYPVSLIYVRKEAFDAYLEAHDLTATEFLNHPRLEAFLETLIVPDASIGDPETEEGAFETIAGTTVVTSGKFPGIGFGGAVGLTLNGVQVSCTVHASSEADGATGTTCFVSGPPSEFDWSPESPPQQR